MKISLWLSGEYPIYINPEWDEIALLAESRPDTIRILESDTDLIVASGYGNTHESLQIVATKVFGRYWRGDPLIMYRHYKCWVMNPDGLFIDRKCAADCIPLSIARKYLSPRLIAFWEDFVALYENR